MFFNYFVRIYHLLIHVFVSLATPSPLAKRLEYETSFL